MPPKDTNIAITLLSRAHSPDTVTRIHTEKVIQRPLHLKPTTTGPTPQTAQQARRTARLQNLSQRRKKQKPAPLSSRQKRSLCLYEIPKTAQKYEIYKELNKMWIGYIQEVLGLEGDGRRGGIGTADAAKLCSADFHGSEVEVVRSRCVSRVGVKGIVVKDSMHAFEIVTKRDHVKVIPKEGTIFRFCVPLPFGGDGGEGVKKMNGGKEVLQKEEERGRELVFELHGDQFMYRAADRANRKFKSHFLPDL